MPILANRDVRQWQWGARQKLFLGGLVRRTIGLHVNRIHGSKGPVANVQSLLVLGRELGPRSELHSNRGSRPNIHQGRQTVSIVLGPLARSTPPTELAAARGMNDPSWTVPRRPDIPLHVRVIDEKLAIAVHAAVVDVAEAAGEDLEGLKEVG